MNKLPHILIALAFGSIVCFSGCGKKADDDSVADLVKRLGSDIEDVRIKAAWLLSKKKAEAVAPLTEALRSADRDLARRAGEILTIIGQPAIDSLREAHADKKFPWPHLAAAAIARIGPPTKEAVDTLLETLKSGDASARAMAADTLGRIEFEAKPLINPLLNALRDADIEVCRNAAMALNRIGAETIAPMIAALTDSRIKHIRPIVLAITKNGSAARKASAPLAAMLKDPDPDIRELAMFALSRIDTDPDIVIKPLIATLDDSRESVSEMSANTLGRIGKLTVKPLIAAMGDSEISRKGHVALALARVGRDAADAIDVLLELLKKGDERDRGLAAFALGAVSSGQQPVLDALTGALKNDPSEYSVQMYAAEALGAIRPPATAAIGALTEAMKHAHEAVRNSAKQAIADIKSPPHLHDHTDHSKCGPDHQH